MLGLVRLDDGVGGARQVTEDGGHDDLCTTCTSDCDGIGQFMSQSFTQSQLASWQSSLVAKTCQVVEQYLLNIVPFSQGVLEVSLILVLVITRYRCRSRR